MPRPPRILVPHTVVMLTSRIQQGIPFVHTPLMEMIIWSALSLAQTLYPVKIIAFVVMGNHVHLIALVEDPTMVESFMERFKSETAHAINRLLGRRQVSVWCAGYDSPAILTIEDLIEKVAYVYANPVSANLSVSVDDYRGVSSWTMFKSGNTTKETKRVRRNVLAQLPANSLSDEQQRQEVLSVSKRSAEILQFTLYPDAWTVTFSDELTESEFNKGVINRIQEIENEMRDNRVLEGVEIPAPTRRDTQIINTTYLPKTFRRRMWCICQDLPRKMRFIRFVKKLRAEGRTVWLKWMKGDFSVPFPAGLFPPNHPILANLTPAFFKRAIFMG